MILEKKILSLNEQLIRKESKNFILSEMKRIGIDKLPYSYSSLSRFIDSETMNFHYNKHYKGYVKKLNKALSEKDYGDVELEEIVKKISRYNKTIRNNAGGAFNHALFWKMLSPKKQQLKGGLLEKINKDFGSFVKFKQKFENLSKKVFGSGWIWLTLSKNNNLKIVTTPNQDNPLMDIVKNGGFPILGLDLWEHAYYLKYRNLRDDYISNFWDFVNWEFVTSLYEKKVKKNPINENMTEKFDRNPFECTKEKEYEYRFVFNVNPKLKKRFQNKLDDIFKELFPENWYEHNEYRKGDIRGLYDFRGQPGRSILNLITTNYSCYCILLSDVNRVLHFAEKPVITIIGKTPEEQLYYNERFLNFIDEYKERIFSENSKTLKKIMDKLTMTKGLGDRREDLVISKLKEIFGKDNVTKSAELGSSEDTNKGVDCKIRIGGGWKTAQIKPYTNSETNENFIEISGVSNIKNYKTDFLIFEKNKNSILVFINDKINIENGNYIIPKSNLLHKID